MIPRDSEGNEAMPADEGDLEREQYISGMIGLGEEAWGKEADKDREMKRIAGGRKKGDRKK